MMMANAIMGCACGALKILKAFSTQSYETIDQTGKATGFWKFYSCSSVSNKSIREELMDKYLDRMIKRVTKEATPKFQSYYTEILNDLQDIKDFESYSEDTCDNSVTTFDFSKANGILFVYIYNFSPYYNQRKKHDSIKISTVKMMARCSLAKDWMIITKVKSSFFKTTSKSELKYLDEKEVQLKDVIEAMSIAFAPAMLGLCKLPERFVKVIASMCEQQMTNPSPGITPPTSEQKQQALDTLKDFRESSNKALDDAQKAFKSEELGLGTPSGTEAAESG